jgi:formylglycine-generating enzyme required for sulfatase activity/predicted Ser/Thr protein kinase
MPTSPRNAPSAEDTVIQPPPDGDRTQRLAPGRDPTQLPDDTRLDLERSERLDVNSVLLGRFKLIQLVGEGGMSDVYKAIDLRKVEAGARNPYMAVKVLTVRFDDHFSSLAVMHQEASKLQTLTHPNIVRVIDWDRDGQAAFMTMEYLDGTSLKFAMNQAGEQGLPAEEAMRIISDIVAALEFAHGKRIVHGDLKPSNVIITAAGETKVIDFGIARFLRRPQDDEPEGPLTGDHVALTPVYASPEMYEDAFPDPRDDIYALACIAHELLTGRHPFNRMPSSAARARGLQLQPLKKLKAHQFRALCHGLNFDRAQRTPNARQFLDELQGATRRSRRQIAIWSGLGVLALAAAILIGRIQSPATAVPEAFTAGQVFRDCPTCPLMVALPPGSFRQGTEGPDTLPFEQPVRAVSIAYPLAAGLHEVTVGEFAAFAKEQPRTTEGCMSYDGEWSLKPSVSWRNAIPGQTASHPVSCVSFQDATDYAAWLSARSGHAYRLPTASEWEYLARAGAAALPWSDAQQACSHANAADAAAAAQYPGWTAWPCNDSYVQSAPVGSFTPNGFGLSDTLGNVFEWVQDCWTDNYAGAATDGSAAAGGDCTQHEARGGSWFTQPDFVRPAYRNRFESGYQSSSLGFRLVREIKNVR